MLSDTKNSSWQRESVAFPGASLALPGPLLPVKCPAHVASVLSSLSWSPRRRFGFPLGAPRDISGEENAVGASSDGDLALCDGLSTPVPGDGGKGLHPQGMGQPDACMGPKLCSGQSAGEECSTSHVAWCELLC